MTKEFLRFALAGLLTLSAAAVRVDVGPEPAQGGSVLILAQTQGMERRDDRRDDRQDNRDERRDGRQENRRERQDDRQENRDERQDRRHGDDDAE